MGNGIAILLLIIQLSLSLFKKKSFEKILVFYITISIIAPNVRVGALSISYEIIGFLILIIQYFWGKRIPMTRMTIDDLLLFILVIVEIVVSAFFATIYRCEFPIFACFGLLRCFLLYKMVRHSNTASPIKDLEQIFGISLIVNLVASIIQITIPRSVVWFYELYDSNSSVVLDAYKEMGYFNRAVGTLETPVLLGPFALCCFSFFVYEYMIKRTLKTMVFILLSLVLGIMALSKTFIVGCPLFFMFILLLSVIKTGKRGNIVRILVACLFVLILGIVLLPGLINKTSISWGAVNYYIGILKHPFDSLESRYSQGGILDKTFDVFMEYPIFGVGRNSVRGEFVGDSAYSNLLHNTGIFGGIIIGFIAVRWLKRSWLEKNMLGIVSIFIIALVGIGFPIIDHILCITFISYGSIKIKRKLNYESHADNP